jgi:hypothetical protein
MTEEKNCTPMTWEEIKEITENFGIGEKAKEGVEDSRWKLGRHPDALKEYTDTIERIKEEHMSVSDYIKISKFSFAPQAVAP